MTKTRQQIESELDSNIPRDAVSSRSGGGAKARIIEIREELLALESTGERIVNHRNGSLLMDRIVARAEQLEKELLDIKNA